MLQSLFGSGKLTSLPCYDSLLTTAISIILETQGEYAKPFLLSQPGKGGQKAQDLVNSDTWSRKGV